VEKTRNRWILGSLAISYVAGLLLLLPWASAPGYSGQSLVGIYGASICVADVCTVVLLLRLYLRDGAPHLLAFAAAYAFSALLVMGHALSFPAAFGSGQVFGHETTSVIIFLCWRVGSASLLLVGVLLGVGSAPLPSPERRPGRAAFALTGSVCAAMAVCTAAVSLHMTPMQGNAFSPGTLLMSWLSVVLDAMTVAVIFATRAYRRSIFGWLATVALVSLADMMLSTIAGARFTLGWYVARCSSVVSAYVLLTYLSIEFARELRERQKPSLPYVYIAAFALAVCAVLLRYFLIPWLGTGIPFATLFGAVAIAVWMGGWGPGALTATLGFLLAHAVIEQPFGVVQFAGAEDFLSLLLYGVSCGLIIALGHNMRMARERSRRAEERFRGSQEAAIQGYAMLHALRDHRGNVVDFVFEYINPRGAELANRRPEQMIGRRMTEVLPGTEQSGLFDKFRAVVDTGTPAEFEVHYDHDEIDGWFRNMVVKIGDGIGISFFDVSQNKQMEHELADRARQLELADLNKSRFLATLSHELRNPLAPLRNGLAIMRRRVGHDSADMMTMLERQFAQLVRLVDDLLDVSRIDRGKIELRHERVNMDTVIASAVETARPIIEAKGHELVLHFAQRALHVEGDSVRLAQIVSNLLINAAKFTPSRGSIEVNLEPVDSRVKISVRDNGAGMEPDELSTVFDMFVQLESHKGQGAGGLGLGLALARSLTELHHGSIEARSEGPGTGSEFIVWLPLAAEAAESARPSGERPEHPATGNRVLVVDDNEDAARTLGMLLRAHGHDVVVVYDSSQALVAGNARSPDVAFIDLDMPGMDGFELARQIRKTAWGARVRLVAVTGMGRMTDVSQSREAGFDAHLTKPGDPDKLLALAATPPAADGNVLAFPRV